MRARRHMAVLLLGPMLAFGLAACGDDDDTTTTTTAGGSTTQPDDTASTTTASDETTTTSGEALGEEPPIHDDGPSGSGCEPGDGDLPDGWWYGDLIIPPGEGLSFDLACYYVGAAAEAEAASRGDEVNNDYYVVNDNPTERSITIAAGATASCVDLGAQALMVDCTPPDVAGDWNVWIRVVGGQVTRMVEQYAP